ncbi:MAG: 2-phosphosulfolactate phosphatase [Nitriliruptoraceae bacterium]|nr:2-phosphosulfolactate phosphatase [Nitriliruptoraceae bacterium]
MDVRFVDLDQAAPDEAVVVIDVLRAFTVQPWMVARGAARILGVAEADHAVALRDGPLPDALLAGEYGGRPLPGFDLGNSPTEVAATDLTGVTLVHRTSAGTQGLARTVGSGIVLAASFVNAGATATVLQRRGTQRVTFVVTGASLGRDGDEDLAAAELIAARLRGEDPDPASYLARVAPSDAGRNFAPDGPDWAPPGDLALACEVDRFVLGLEVTPVPDLDAVESRVVRID